MRRDQLAPGDKVLIVGVIESFGDRRVNIRVNGSKCLPVHWVDIVYKFQGNGGSTK